MVQNFCTSGVRITAISSLPYVLYFLPPNFSFYIVKHKYKFRTSSDPASLFTISSNQNLPIMVQSFTLPGSALRHFPVCNLYCVSYPQIFPSSVVKHKYSQPRSVAPAAFSFTSSTQSYQLWYQAFFTLGSAVMLITRFCY